MSCCHADEYRSLFGGGVATIRSRVDRRIGDVADDVAPTRHTIVVEPARPDAA